MVKKPARGERPLPSPTASPRLRKADLILVVDRGTIVASGAHETLLHTSPLYQELWNAQQVNPAARVEYR